MAEKYNVSLWKDYMKSTEVEVSTMGTSPSITSNGTEKPLYFYFQYPDSLKDSSQWLYYRPRYKLFDNSSSDPSEISLICTNLNNLANKNDIKFLISKSILTLDGDGKYETSAGIDECIKAGDKLIQQDTVYTFSNLEIGVYWAKGTYYEIHSYAAGSDTPFTVKLKRGHSGMIWYVVAHLKDSDNNNKYELLMTYNLSDYQQALTDLLSGNHFSSPEKYWERIGDGSGGYYYYAEAGLSFLDKPSDINDYYKGNNRLSFSVEDYKITYRGLELKTGGRIKINGNYYSFIYADANGICYYEYDSNTREWVKKFVRYPSYFNLTISAVFDYIDERRIFTITDSEMRALCKGREPRLKVNINGTKEFYFNLYYNYIDNETGEEVNNPFVPLISNESKIKVQWDNEWYDFVVKDIKEDTSQRYISYTCKDLFIHELSKNGYSVELDDELMNNQGTIEELGTTILEGSDWKVAEDSDLIYQYTDEPLCLLEDQSLSLSLQEINSSNDPISLEGTQILEVGVFYSSTLDGAEKIECLYPINSSTLEDKDGLVLTNKKIKQYVITEGLTTPLNLSVNTNYRGRRLVQSQRTKYDSLVEKNVLIYSSETVGEVHGWYQTKFRTPNSVQNLIANGENFVNTSGWSMDNKGTVTITTDPVFPPSGNNLINILQSTLLEELTCTGTELVSESGYTLMSGDYIFTIDTTKTPAAIVKTYLVSDVSATLNTSISTSTKIAKGTATFIDIETGSSVTYKFGEQATNNFLNSARTLKRDIKSYIPIQPNVNYFNNGLVKNAHYLENGLQPNQLYVFRYKRKKRNQSDTFGNQNITLEIKSDYAAENPLHSEYLNYEGEMSYVGEDGYIYDFYRVGSNTPLTKDNIVSEKWQFKLKTTLSNIKIEEAQFFEVCMCQKDGVNYMILPGEIEKEPLYQPYLYLYSTFSNMYALSKDDISYLYAGPIGTYTTPGGEINYSDDLTELIESLDLTPDLSYEKITSISGKESNRYNLIQSACEKFQCWAQFLIRHDPQTGKILTLMDLEEGDNTPIKQIRFKKDLTIPKGISFTDGLDLNSINKTLVSQDIVTKMYVKPNITDAAEDGIVTIAKSDINPTLDTYILNFDYYISAGLLDEDTTKNDLWGTNPENSIAYYYNIRNLNLQYDELSRNRTRLKADLDENYSYLDVYRNFVSDSGEELQNIQNQLVQFINGLKDASENTIICEDFATAVQHILTKDFKGYLIPDRAVIRFLTFLTINVMNYNYSKKLQELNRIVIKLENSIKEIDLKIEEIVKRKNDIEEILCRKYGSYIFEGVWNSSDYIDNNKYFYDAVNVAYTSSRPTIKYTFNVIRLASLEEYKDRRIQVGDIDYVQDSKLFGYKEDGITPNKEKVVVSEIMYYFDSPEKDVVTIQNYRTQFEDLMSRIVATVQTPSYAPAQYISNTKATIVSPSLPSFKV